MLKLFILLASVTFVVDAYAVGTTIVTAIALAAATNATIAAITAFAINMAVSFIVSKVLTPSNTTPGAGADPGVRIQVPPDTTRSVPVIYGDAYIGGKFVDAVMTTDSARMYYVMAISCISPDGQFTFDKTKFYYGDRLCTFDTTDPSKVVSLTDGAGNVDTKISGNLFIYLFKSTAAGVITNLDVGGTSAGTATPQNVMSTANGVPAGLEWAASGRQMNGLAFAIINLHYNRDAETTQLQPITFYAKHALRGTGVAKPGDVWYDYMTNPVYGGAVDPAFVDYANAVNLNIYADQLITFNDYNGVPQTQSRYRINGVLDTNQNILQNVDQIMTACDSWMTYDAPSGKWSVTINQATVSSFAFDDSNILGSITVGGIDITRSINQIEAKFPDATNRDQYNYAFLEVPVGLLYPNEPVNKSNVNYDLVNNSVQALYLANRLLEQAREDLNVSFKTTYVGIQTNAGDVVTVTNSYYGWTNKLFRVMQVQEVSLPDGNLGAQIQLAEYNVQVYDNFDINQFTPAPNTDLTSGGYFGALVAPTVVNINSSATVPNFGVQITFPAIGRITNTTLFYTTEAAPTVNQWQVLDSQVLINSQTFTNGSTFIFTDLQLPTGSYYFAFKVGNDVAQSNFSPLSAVFVWNPAIIGADTFLATFNPPNFLVPFTTVPTFTGINAKLYGNNAGGSVDFIPAQTDSDVTFIANTWRIGGSSTTGYGDITKTGITIGNPIDLGNYAEFPLPTAMPTNPATMTVPVRFKDSAGTVFQVNPATVQFAYAQQGASGQKSVTASLYQWSTTTPANPTGTSTYTWATGANTGYTGGNGWSTTIPANPGVPLILLWTATKELVVDGSTTTTTIDWTTGVSVASVGQNGAAGVQTATPTVFKWDISVPVGPTGSSTYTWASGTFTPTPSTWSLTPPASPSPGYTLWGATVSLVASATQNTSSINWTTATVSARGYAGDDGSTGATGTTGASARICYSKTTLSSLASSPATITTSGSTSFPPNGSWGGDTVWQATPPAIVAGESVYQSDGIYSPTTNQTVWNVPYLSALKVGQLSAITANLGQVTAGNMTIGTTSQGLYVNNPTYPNAVYVFQNSRTIYGLNVQNAYNTNNGGGAARFTSNHGFTADFSMFGNGVNPNPAYKNCAIAASSATGGIAFIAVTGANGGFAGYALAGTWSPFTGSHDGLIEIGTTIDQGDIVIDAQIVVTKVSDSLTIVERSSAPNQSGAIGIFVSERPLLAGVPAALMTDGVITDPTYVDTLAETYNNTVINGVGEGAVNVCGEGGDISIGDLIVTSSIAGKGMKQSDNIVRSTTVARARQAVTFASPTEVKLVACIYLCG
jgi:hypothetical protein